MILAATGTMLTNNPSTMCSFVGNYQPTK